MIFLYRCARRNRKRFLYRAILATIQSKGIIALATATSGITASLLPGGRTAHYRFKIPLEENHLKAVTYQNKVDWLNLYENVN